MKIYYKQQQYLRQANRIIKNFEQSPSVSAPVASTAPAETPAPADQRSSSAPVSRCVSHEGVSQRFDNLSENQDRIDPNTTAPNVD